MIRLKQNPLIGLFINPFGTAIKALELEGDLLRVVKRGGCSTLSLLTIRQIPKVQRGSFGTTLTVESRDLGQISLRGANYRAASAFAQVLEAEWTNCNTAAFRRASATFDSVYAAVSDLENPTRYPAACTLVSTLRHAIELNPLLSVLKSDAIGPEEFERVAAVKSFVADPRQTRNNAVALFVEAELSRWAGFFNSIEKDPLTQEQRLAVVANEDATLVLAGAGSGKTSVITAKAAYLITAGIRHADEVLILAFAKDAAREISDRIQNRCGAPISARTFHAIAYDIIGRVEGTKPPLAEHVTDEAAFLALINRILGDLVRSNPKVAHSIVRWFAHYFVEPKTEWDFETKHAFYTHLEQQDLRTLQGEKVKSYEELQIANWLFQNGIDYEYEPIYEHKVSSAGRRDYCPDFRLVESGVYIEHFGVRRQELSDGTVRLTTAPFVDRATYLAGMEWKRQVHASKGTILIETFSYERQDGTLLSRLAEKLEPYVTRKPRDALAIYDRVMKLKQVDVFSQLLGTFLRKFKSGSYTLGSCRTKAEQLKLGSRAKAFLEVFAPVLDAYKERLGGRIDFEDMVLRAAQYVENGIFISPFRHILVDEFQDISQSRSRLVKALKEQHPDARLFAVGDDWQSIFRFAGSDIHFMRQFGTEFGGTFAGEVEIHGLIDLGRTFRSVDQIAFAARSFVLKNPAQILKQIIPASEAAGPAIRIVMTRTEESQTKLLDILENLSRELVSDTPTTGVLLLGRYRFVKPDVEDLQRQFPRLRIRFKTIHASKGLEDDHVILLKADSGRAGFPSEIVDDPLLALVSPEEDMFPHAEERRVMYVAMTRARKSLTVLASVSRPSSFVTELLSDPSLGLVSSSDALSEAHTCGSCGGRLLATSARPGRMRYRCEHVHLCGNLLPACTVCGHGLPIREKELSVHRCGCGETYPSCPECTDGWLVERRGSFGSFYGCVRFPACTGKAQKSPNAVESQASMNTREHKLNGLDLRQQPPSQSAIRRVERGRPDLPQSDGVGPPQA